MRKTHHLWHIFCVQRLFFVRWVSCPPPRPPLHPYLPSMKNMPTWACFWCLVRLHLFPPAENETCAICGAFFVFSGYSSVGILPLPPPARCHQHSPPAAPRSPLPTKHEKHAHMGVFLVFGPPLFVPPCQKWKMRPVCTCFFFGAPSAVPVALNT